MGYMSHLFLLKSRRGCKVVNFHKMFNKLVVVMVLLALYVIFLAYLLCSNFSKLVICEASPQAKENLSALSISKMVVPSTKHKVVAFKKSTTKSLAQDFSRGGLSISDNVADTLDGFQVTYYNDSINKTASGTTVTDDRTVAVDTRVIPLGTKMEIIMPDGSILNGVAEDTGSAVKGRIIDIYASVSEHELRRRGRVRGVTVRILRRR